MRMTAFTHRQVLHALTAKGIRHTLLFPTGFAEGLHIGSFHQKVGRAKFPLALTTVDDVRYLYTTGFIPALKAYPHGHVPSPLQIADHIGDSSLTTLQEEILVLTKMNWNTTAFADVRPITLRFSQLVGDILREIPVGREPLPQFKYYM